MNLNRHIRLFFSFIVIIVASLACMLMVSINRNYGREYTIEFKNYRKQLSIKICDVNNYVYTSYYMQNDVTYYLYLPSYLRDETFYIDKLSCQDIKIDGEIVDNNILLSESTHIIELDNDKYKLNVMYSQNTEALCLDLDEKLEFIEASKDNCSSGKIIAFNPDGTIAYDGKIDKLSGHGDSSWTKEKKSYNLNLNGSSPLFNMNKGKKYVLISNVYDDSYIRNKLVFDISKETEIRYSPDSIYVDLYINGEYRGDYLLTEKIELSPQKLFWGGVIIEQVHPAKIRDEDKYFVSDGCTYLVKDPNSISENDLLVINDLFDEVHEEIISGDITSAAAFDIKSFVDRNLIDEIFKNVDGSFKSTYYYWDSKCKKLYAGPVWDYDQSLGETDISNGIGNISSKDPEGLYTAYAHGLYNDCYKNDTYYNIMVDEYRQLRNTIKDITELKLSEYTSHSQSWIMDASRWGKDANYEYIIRRENEWLNNRIKYLDELWLSDRDITITCIDDSDVLYRFYAKSGTMIDLPTDDMFLWKYNRNGNWEYSINNNIIADKQDMTLYKVTKYEGTYKPLNAISVSRSIINMNVGERGTYEIYYNPADATISKDIVWTIENPSIVDVQTVTKSNGTNSTTRFEVTAKKEGVTKIVADCNGISTSAVIVVGDGGKVNSIAFNTESIKVHSGEDEKIYVYFDNPYSVDKKIVWLCSNPDIAECFTTEEDTAVSAIIRGYKKGTTSIKAYYPSGKLFSEIEVEVLE